MATGYTRERERERERKRERESRDGAPPLIFFDENFDENDFVVVRKTFYTTTTTIQ